MISIPLIAPFQCSFVPDQDIDLEWVKWAALNSVDATEPLPGSNAPIVTTITLTSATPRRAERQQVTDLIRSALADGRCVYVEPCHLQGCYEWDLENLSRLRGRPQASAEWHGTNYMLRFEIFSDHSAPDRC